MKKENLTLRKRLDRRLFMYQIRYWYWKLRTKDRILKWLYCRRGWHKLKSNYLRVEHSKRTGQGMRCEIDSHWVECIYCNMLFFDSREERDKYVRYQKIRQDRIRVLSKHHLKALVEAQGIKI